MTAPTIGPETVPIPPMITMNTIETVQSMPNADDGRTDPLLRKKSPPAMAMNRLQMI